LLDNQSAGLWRQFFDTPSYQKFFGAADETEWKYTIPGTVEGVVARALSKSYISVLPDREREEVVDNLRNVLETERKTWIDEEGGIFEYPYETTVVTAHKK
jgi:hypothetical protein